MWYEHSRAPAPEAYKLVMSAIGVFLIIGAIATAYLSFAAIKPVSVILENVTDATEISSGFSLAGIGSGFSAPPLSIALGVFGLLILFYVMWFYG